MSRIDASTRSARRLASEARAMAEDLGMARLRETASRYLTARG